MTTHTLETSVQEVATVSSVADAQTSAAVEAIAVPRYREPLSGKSFPTEAQAVRHGLRMQKAVRIAELKKKRQDLWLSVESADSVLTCLKEAMCLLIEEWELRFERKKSATVPPEWKSARIAEWSLGTHGLINVVAEFEVWHDNYMYKQEVVDIDIEGLSGNSGSERAKQTPGNWRIFRGRVIQAEAGARGSVGKTGHEYRQYTLSVALPVKGYPSLYRRVKEELDMLGTERQRRDQIGWQIEDAQEADADLTANKAALDAAEAEVRRLRSCVQHQEQAIEDTIRESAEVKASHAAWTMRIANTVIGAQKLEHLAHNGYQWDLESNL